MPFSLSSTIQNVTTIVKSRFKMIAAVAIFGMGLSLAYAAPVSAAPAAAPKDISYSYVYQWLQDRDGLYYYFHFIGGVDYTTTNGVTTAKTTCAYKRSQTPSQSIVSAPYVGGYSVPYAIADKSSASIKAFCIANVNNRSGSF